MYYYISDFLQDPNSIESKKVLFPVKIFNVISTGVAPNVKDTSNTKFDIPQMAKDLEIYKLNPIQISNFSGVLINSVPVKIMSKNCTIHNSWLEKILNIRRDEEIDRTTVMRNYDGKCKEIPINSYDLLVRFNSSERINQIYKVSFTPQIELRTRNVFSVSDFVYAKFMGLFGETKTIKIRV
jgi:hypothetical protein